MVADILIYETLNGGDIVLNGADIVTVSGIENQPYLATFGGENWHGNAILSENPGVRFTSETERVMNETPLSSAGRLAIEQAAVRDTAYLKEIYPGEKVDVSVAIVNVNRIDVEIALAGTQMKVKWNPNEVTMSNT